jgi:hypothetical protein
MHTISSRKFESQIIAPRSVESFFYVNALRHAYQLGGAKQTRSPDQFITEPSSFV